MNWPVDDRKRADFEALCVAAMNVSRRNPGKYGGRYVAEYKGNIILLTDDDPELYRENEDLDILAHCNPEGCAGVGRMGPYVNKDGSLQIGRSEPKTEDRRPAFNSRKSDDDMIQVGGSSPDDLEEYLEKCEWITDMVAQIEEYKYYRATDFFDGISEKAAEMHGTISKSRRLSDKQRVAIDNMEEGLAKWL